MNITISYMNQASRWLKNKREEAGLSFRELAKAVKINHTTIAQAEQKGYATTQTWIKLAEFFNESILKVLYWAKEMKQPPSNEDVIEELQNRLILKIIESFPADQQEAVISRMMAEVDWLHESQKREKPPRATSQKYS